MKYQLNSSSVEVGHLRGAIARELAEQAEPKADIPAAELIVGELISNIVRHAPGDFELSLGWDADGFATLDIRDRGEPFAFPRPPTPPTQAGGHGLNLVRALAVRVSVRHENDGNAIRVVLPVRRRA
ncbi:MAG: ATP-binding protein [Candidatus Eremiobacteraeota bacterium]|nr:ATP-binding protein [Candidatus Eremiobacteraeota bacterium]